MSSAHRPTWNPARGSEGIFGSRINPQNLAAHTVLKIRRDAPASQGASKDVTVRRDLKAELERAEREALNKRRLEKGLPPEVELEDHQDEPPTDRISVAKAIAQRSEGATKEDEEDKEPSTKRIRLIQEAVAADAESESESEASEGSASAKEEDEESFDGERKGRARGKGKGIKQEKGEVKPTSTDDAHVSSKSNPSEQGSEKDGDQSSSSGGEEGSSDEEDEDEEEDDTAALLAELEKIKRERAEEKERKEKEAAALAQNEREDEIALGNPLLNLEKAVERGQSQPNFGVKRRWDDGTWRKGGALRSGAQDILGYWSYLLTLVCPFVLLPV